MNSKAGMTLLEVILATAIFATALVALAVSIGQAIRAYTMSQNIQAAVQVARGRMSEWKFSQKDGQVQTGSAEGEQLAQGRKFIWKHDIEATEVKEVFRSNLIVEWTDAGQIRQKKFVSLLQNEPKPPAGSNPGGTP